MADVARRFERAVRVASRGSAQAVIVACIVDQCKWGSAVRDRVVIFDAKMRAVGTSR